ncbi:MAG: carboxypeptidase M32 [Mangrovicoccus sp.]|nr:carboxypeptidase M32 [Mangrovicoccus sp.]
MSALGDLLAFQRDTSALGQIAGRLGWDQETMMPEGASAQRAEEMAALESVLHARRSDPRIGEWLAQIETPTDPIAAAHLREITRSYERAVKIPARLAAELARVTSIAQGEWAAARAADDFAAFVPRLSEIVALKREEAAALAEEGSAYDALLQDYEPGASAAELEAMFGALRPRLVALRAAILDAPQPALPELGQFDEAAQLALAQELAQVFGYDLNRGRIDTAVHPFSSGSGADVRITTRTDPADPFNCLYSTLHEVGHAVYEQNVDPDLGLSILGQGASMGVHESQSRLFENQLGRSRAFCSWLHGRMQARFGAALPGGAEDFYRLINQVHPGCIRTEADELHYNLHVLMRFDLERALIAGDLAVADLDGAWNERFASDFGVQVPRSSLGCLQDVHWSVGLFGYFPTYTIGNLYAGCLFAALQQDLPDLDGELAQGNPGPALAWLREKVQCHGAAQEPRALIEAATGMPPSAEPLLAYLEAKFSDLYGL